MKSAGIVTAFIQFATLPLSTAPPSPPAPEAVKESISVLLDKCPPWLRGTLGGSFPGTYDHPLAPSLIKGSRNDSGRDRRSRRSVTGASTRGHSSNIKLQITVLAWHVGSPEAVCSQSTFDVVWHSLDAHTYRLVSVKSFRDPDYPPGCPRPSERITTAKSKLYLPTRRNGPEEGKAQAILAEVQGCRLFNKRRTKHVKTFNQDFSVIGDPWQ